MRLADPEGADVVDIGVPGTFGVAVLAGIVVSLPSQLPLNLPGEAVLVPTVATCGPVFVATPPVGVLTTFVAIGA